LDFDVKQGGYVVDVDTEKLRSAPNFGADDDPWLDPAYPIGIRDYWGSPRSIGSGVA
jgi:hypothetical protein